MSETLNALIQQELQRRGLTERAASRRAGLDPGTLNGILKHPEGNPESPTCRKLAKFFHWDEDYILELAGHRTPRAIREAPVLYTELLRRVEQEGPAAIPIYDQIIHAGRGGQPMDYTYIPAGAARGKRLAAAYVRGDCMEPEIREGNLIVVDLDASPQMGDVVVALQDGDEVLLRRLIKETDGTLLLRCDNPVYHDVEVDNTRILGVVIETSRKLRR